jgi:hypothetical protein
VQDAVGLTTVSHAGRKEAQLGKATDVPENARVERVLGAHD